MKNKNKLLWNYMNRHSTQIELRNKRKKKLTSKILKSMLATSILLSTVGTSSLTVFAVEDNIMGVPIQKFDLITNSEKKLDVTLGTYEDNKELDGYKIKYMQDSYSYMYNILKVSEELSENKTDVIPTHIAKYNKNLKSPLTNEDQIDAEIESDDAYIVRTKSDIAKAKLSGLVGVKGQGDEDTLTYFKLLTDVRKELGFTEEVIKDSTYEDSNISETKMNSYLKDNISEIRFLMTSTKEFIIEYKEFITEAQHAELSTYFVDTYDKIVKFSYDNNIDALKELNLLGESVEVMFSREAPEAENNLGKWVKKEKSEEEMYILENYSEYMLKNISASSTFRPFETSLNNVEAFDFLGEENKLFHEVFGTKRKMILTTTPGYSDINTAMNKGSVKSLKFMTLRDFIKSPSKPKVMYLDNLEYTLSEIDEAQKVATGKEEKTEGEDATELDELAGATEEQTKPGFWTRVNNKLDAVGVWANNLNPFFDHGIGDTALGGQEALVEETIFASANMDDVGKAKGTTKDKLHDINEGYLIYTNILEEYYSKKNELKMDNDMDKPLYVDIYGNIVSASGIVIIPAMSNPFLFKDEKPSFHFNRAFIESYPEYTVDKGLLKVNKKDDKKMSFGLKPMTDEGVKLQEELLDITIGDLSKYAPEGEKPKSNEKPKEEEKDEDADPEEISEDTSGDLGEDMFGVVPGVQYHVTPAKGNFKSSEYTKINNVKPIANKFDNDYKSTKALDIWSFSKVKGSSLDTYEQIRSNIEALEDANRRALIEEYTVKLSYAESDGGEVVSFLDMPNSKEIKRFMYITNLDHVAEIEGTDIKDKKVLDTSVAHKISSEVYINGVYETNQLNSLVPEFIDNIYGKYVEFLLGMANNRYDSVLDGDTDNSILYAKSIEEIKVLKNVLPLVYKVLLLIAIAAIIIHLILTVIVEDSKWKQIGKIFTVLYVVTFLLNTSAWMIDTLINKPTTAMFSKENSYWTLVEQEKNTHLKEKVSKDEIVDKEVENGSKIKLYKIPYNYPYKMLTSSSSEGSISIDEFYEHYLTNDGRFRAQNNEMYVEGNYLVTDTKTIFDSSSVVVNDDEDVRLRLTHEVYRNPELAYYMPYYMFIDNIVYNLNALTEIGAKIPNDLAYVSGEVKTTGRIYNYVNSAMFLDYEEFMRRVDEYESSDKISEELSTAKIKDVTETYGNPNDFLGIRKILNLVNEDELQPFNADGIKKVQNTGWYPVVEETLSRAEADDLERRALKVNDKVKSFMLGLANTSGEVADEHLIKTIALYASLEFNKEFGSFATNSGPKNIELSGVPIERLLMSLSLPREELIDNSVSSYSNYIVESEGYWGLLLSSFNDLLIVFINYVKPFIMVFIWAMAGIIIFFKKVIIPDPNNRSILGSLKIMAFYIVSSLAYSIALLGIIKIINADGKLVVGQLLLLVCNLLYIYAILVMVFALIKDGVNMGNSVIFKGLEKITKAIADTTRGAVQSVPLFNNFAGRESERISEKTEHLGDYFEQKSLKYSEGVGDIGIRTPIDLGTKTVSAISQKVTRRGRQSQDNFNRNDDYNNGYLVDKPSRNGYTTNDSFSFETNRNSARSSDNMMDKENKEIERERKLKEEYVNANKPENQLDSIKPSYIREEAQEDYLNNNRR